ncbi:MAG TPA: hypothetical protein VGG79_24180 [Roseiarcus sp.]
MSRRRDEGFERALDEAQRTYRASGDGEPAPTQRPRVGVGVPLGPTRNSGGKARFGLALDWTDEAADQPRPERDAPPREAPPGPSDMPIGIAAELGLDAPLTLRELTSRWRDFVWRHHPDRQPIEARDRANARVAIANALYQRARRELAEKW